MSIKKPTQTQQGFVSIFVTMMLIIIVSLLILAFAQASRREQRESLDTQLSSQAYYAAETGVNDAKAAITSYLLAHPGADVSRTSCTSTGQPYASMSGTKDLNGDGSVAYTCVLVDQTPTTIPVTIGKEDRVIPLQTNDGSTFQSVTISWSSASGVPSATTLAKCPTTTQLPPANSSSNPTASWQCPFGGLRMDLVPYKGSQTVGTLYANNMVAFLMPSANAGNTGRTNYAASSGVVVPAAKCNTNLCTVTIRNLAASSLYYLRLSQLYIGSTVTITGISNSGPVQFQGAVALVDATGKAQDVLRRILVSVPLQQSAGGVPSSALNSGDSVCKRFKVRDGFFQTDQTNVGRNTAGGAGNPFCS